MELEYILEINSAPDDSVSKKGEYEYIIEVEKFNPYHDRLGRFTTAGGAGIQVDSAPGRAGRNNSRGGSRKPRNEKRDADNKPMGIKQALAGTNPHFHSRKGDYQNNCQRCVQVYEMRRRGMDVSAAPYPAKRSNIVWGIECFTKSGTIGEADRIFKKNMTKKGLEAALNKAPINSRHVIYVQKLNGDAHVFIAEKRKDGVLFVDPQSGEMNCIQHLTGVTKMGFGIFRIDNRPLTSNQSAILDTIEVKRK